MVAGVAYMVLHQPVLVQTILANMPQYLSSNSMEKSPQKKKGGLKSAWVLDATFGRGGHTKALLEHFSNISVVATDCDKVAVEWGLKNGFLPPRVHLFHANFQDISKVIKKCFSTPTCQELFDIIIIDLGVSSPQLTQANRGFSFYKDGPLDMRMDQTQDFTASDIVNTWSKEELQNLFSAYKQLHNHSKVINMLLKERKKQKITRTTQLARVIEKHTSWKASGTHPATLYFLALRIAVNQELSVLQQALPHLLQYLKPGGFMFVLSFHSLEDRIIKQTFQKYKKLSSKADWQWSKKVIHPTREEIKQNPRARSAKLRIFKKPKVQHFMSDYNND